MDKAPFQKAAAAAPTSIMAHDLHGWTLYRNSNYRAARAGEAGKGSAVVANEIKELAKQTAVASGEIKQQVEGIHTATQGTVTEIGSIARVVGQVNASSKELSKLAEKLNGMVHQFRV